MAIKNVEIKNFLVFKGEFATDFCEGVNVLIGGNGTGKTTLLREMYYRTQPDALFHNEVDYNVDFVVSTNHSDISSSIYIPEKDMLSIARGLPESRRHAKTDLRSTDIDVIEKSRVLSQCSEQPLYRKICEIIGGEPEHDGQSFFMKRFDVEKLIPFSMEASGYRKFGLLAMLVRNEMIKPGTVLFWDEPENSLNPELVPKLVEILVELANSGVQIFIATHDYKVARYFDIRKQKNVPVLFHNLTKADSGQIVCNSSPQYKGIRNNLIEAATEELFNAVVADSMEVIDSE